jgi:hypothetical protein
MLEIRKLLFVFLAVSLAITVLYTPAWSDDTSIDYPNRMYDLLCARPAAFLGGIGGTAVFVIVLPFTLPSGGAKDSFNMFIAKPFWYAFVRKFPDEKSKQ